MINPMHPQILRSYRGVVQGDDATGLTDIEFPTMHHAASWAQTCEISERVTIREDSTGRTLASAIVVQYAR